MSATQAPVSTSPGEKGVPLTRSPKLIALAAGASVLTAAVLAATLPANGNSSSAHRQAKNCPVLPVPPRYGEIDEVIAAARRLLIRGSITVQGKTTKLTPRNSPIYNVVILARLPNEFAGAATLRRMAAKRCGSETAQASWAVMIGVPELMADSSTRLAFLVKTKSGWRRY
jgi:hypothetical protein